VSVKECRFANRKFASLTGNSLHWQEICFTNRKCRLQVAGECPACGEVCEWAGGGPVAELFTADVAAVGVCKRLQACHMLAAHACQGPLVVIGLLYKA